MTCRSKSAQHPEGFPTATVTDYRSPLWLVGRQQPSPRVHATAWGQVRVERGNPTVLHRDILDAVFSVAERASQTPTGELYVLFDAAAVLNLLGTKADSRWLRQRLLDLMQVVISTRSSNSDDWPPSRPLLTCVGDTDLDAGREEWQFPAKLKKIVLSPAAVQAMADDIQIVLDKKIVANVLGLRHAISRSLARWMMSHKTKQVHDVDALIDALGANQVGDRQRRAYVAQLTADVKGLAVLGIQINNNFVTYTRPEKGIWFQMPGAE